MLDLNDMNTKIICFIPDEVLAIFAICSKVEISMQRDITGIITRSK